MPYVNQQRGNRFSFTNASTIAASASVFYDPQQSFRNARDYLPFDAVSIANDSNEELKLYFNETNVEYLPANSVGVFNTSKYVNVKITNNGTGTIAANTIQVTFISEVGGTDVIGKALASNSLVKKVLGI